MEEKHVFLTGSSGGGKTSHLKMMYRDHDGIAVWVNHGDRSAGLPGWIERVESFEAIARRIEACESIEEVRSLRLIYDCPSDTAAIAPLKRLAKRVSDHFSNRVCTLIAVDECAPLLPDDDEDSARENNPLAWLFHEGRDLNCKVAVATQDPGEVSYTPVKNLKWLVWAGKSKMFHRGFKQYWGLQDLDLPRENHKYVVMDPLDPPEIVYKGETDPEPFDQY